jgi:hypothetical protein
MRIGLQLGRDLVLEPRFVTFARMLAGPAAVAAMAFGTSDEPAS